MTLAEIYQYLCVKLSHTESPTSEAWELLRHATPWQPKDLIARPQADITPDAVLQLKQWVTLRQQGKPLAYILEKKHFWKFDLAVNEAVLIPRSDTECLIEWLLAQFPEDSTKTVLDLGTGSGAIAIALAVERPHWHIIATDQSETALSVAKHNAMTLGATNVSFYLGNWFAALDQSVPGVFDIIISNPPYIANDDPYLQQGDLPFEPKIALIASHQGFEALHHIIALAPTFLQAPGLLILEHGYQQQAQLMVQLEIAQYQNIQGHCDYQSNPRFVTASKPLRKESP